MMSRKVREELSRHTLEQRIQRLENIVAAWKKVLWGVGIPALLAIGSWVIVRLTS